MDGLLYLVLMMPAELEKEYEEMPAPVALSSSVSPLKKQVEVQSGEHVDDHLQQTRLHWREFIRQRLAVVQGGVESKGVFTSFLSPLISHGFSSFRSALDNLGLSSDQELVTLRFNLWLQHALESQANISERALLNKALLCIRLLYIICRVLVNDCV